MGYETQAYSFENHRGDLILSRAPDGVDARALADMMHAACENRTNDDAMPVILHIARDDQRVSVLRDCLAFFATRY